MSRTIFTVGHSTHAWDDFLNILTSHGVKAVADVRRYPGSKRHPHFNSGQLAVELPKHEIDYLPMPALGGRRKPARDSPNTAWRNEAFRGYADYLQTPPFLAALDELQSKAALKPTAIMCAEAVPWRCHRSLIADALIVRGWTVLDIYDAKQIKEHKLTDFALVDGQSIIYPAIAPKSPGELF
jgi:uncharacterized protein (DUF488 family)